MKVEKPHLIALVLFFSVLMVACEKSERGSYSPKYGEGPVAKKAHYVIGVHPLHNPQRLLEVFGPLADLLTEQIDGAHFVIEASRNYDAFDEKLYAGKFSFALPNPYQTVLSLKHGYRVFGKMGDDTNFRGIIITRKNSNINNPSDLKGKTVTFPAPTALVATMMPQNFLNNNGIDIQKDIKINYVGSQESSIMNVFYGNADAGATWPPPWRALTKERPQLLDTLEVKWQTEPLPNNGFVVRADVPQLIVDQVTAILFDIHNTEKGRLILDRMELSRFEPALDGTYQPVVAFLKKFNSKDFPYRTQKNFL